MADRKPSTDQLEFWRSSFGVEYAQRNQNIVTEEGLRRLLRDWGRMLAHAVTPRPESALEVGCNVGRNLVALRHFVPTLAGVEPNEQVVRMARESRLLDGVDLRVADGFALPFAAESFDLVFTSGVLIHVAPDDLGRMVDEIYRVSRRYLLCIEYFSHEPVSAPYHGRSGYLFKRDFGRFYVERFPGLRVVDYGFLWQLLDSADNCNWWLFSKS